ncbi:MAG: long-chain-fatty-acid--CoA ligase [Desulfobacteraceae bacterium]|nr:long-chain-fatty-acid--CoA ligase [Desulfobacteraceae bacterium]MBC2754868.1 long-chain-fatty-acid--CoA ligase [Desulfobacteraceae bacterium]
MHHETVNYDILTPVKFLTRSGAIYSDKTAMVHGKTRYTYEQFLRRVYRLANALKNAGVEKGDKVAFICPNIPPMIEAHFAVPMIGAVLVSVNIRLSSGEVGYILNHSEAKVLVVDNEFGDLIHPVLDDLKYVETIVNVCDVSSDIPLPGTDYESFLAFAADDPVPCDVTDEYSVAAINYTSGTTGFPKGVMYHHRGAYLNALGEVIEFGLNSGSVYLWTLPMFHCNGWCFPWAVTAVGGIHICLRKVEAETTYHLVDTERVTHLCAAPTVLIALSTYAAEKNLQLNRHLEIMTAGAPPAPQVIENMEAVGANITQTYGLTEVFGPHSICKWQDNWNDFPAGERARIKARQGVPYVNALYMDVVDSNTMEPVPRDGRAIGEIVMRGNNVMLGYYKDKTATDKAFDGGWFHSGDLAVMHPDGYIQIMDRQKDIIISGGENISTVEVENTIYKHPDVLEVAVVSTPHTKWGEVPKAFVKPKPGSFPTEQDIITFCKENMARFKAPKIIEFGDLPKTATGKIQKFKLREKEWSGHARKVA